MDKVLPTEVLIPTGAKLIEIQDKYGPLASTVKCGIQNCRTAHGKGFIVSFTDETGENPGVGIVGHVCGKNAFQTTWTQAEQAYDVKIRSEQMAGARERFMTRAGHILPRVDAAIPRLRILRAARKAIEDSEPGIFRQCSEAAKTGRWQIEVVNYNGHLVSTHRLEGGSFWLAEPPPLVRALGLQADMSRFLDYLSSPEANNTDVEKCLSKFVDIEYRWDFIDKSMVNAEITLKPQHLKALFIAFKANGYSNSMRMRGNILERLNPVERSWQTVVSL